LGSGADILLASHPHSNTAMDLIFRTYKHTCWIRFGSRDP
jgi:hypothetical protein